MKVLALLPQPNWGGLHAHLATTAQALGNDFRVVAALPDSPESAEIATRFEGYGIETVKAPMSRLRFSDVAANARYFWRLKREVAALSNLVEREGFDIIQSAGAHHFHGALVSRRTGVPLVWQIHSDLAPSIVRRGVVPFIHRRAAAIMINGQSIAARFPGLTAGASPIFYFGPVVNPDDVKALGSARDELRAEWSIAPDAVVVGTVGVRARQKQHELFVETAGRLAASDKPVVFVIAGKPVAGAEHRYEREVLGTAVARRLVEQGRLHFIDPSRPIADYLSAFDVFAMTSRAEGMPIAVAEAMLLGLPVVTVDVGGLGEMVSGDAGYLVAPGDAAALSDRIMTIAANPALRREIGARGQAKALSDYSPQASAAVHASAYRTAFARRSDG